VARVGAREVEAWEVGMAEAMAAAEREVAMAAGAAKAGAEAVESPVAAELEAVAREAAARG
jgi:hypothetical protein